MKKNLILFIFLMSIITLSAQETNYKSTTYYLIRHAEKVRSDATDKNPDLNEMGHQRAEKWKNVFQYIDFHAIYSTDFIRTLKTAMPISLERNLEIKIYHPTKIDFEAFKKETLSKNVLIIGHSNSIPQFVNKLINQEKYKEIVDDEFSHLYIITIKENQISDILLKIDF